MARTDDRFREAFNLLLDLCATAAVGGRLPSEAALATRLGVSRTVVRATLERARDCGIIAWTGRDKTILRPPRAFDRVEPPGTPVSAEELEQAFLGWVLRFDVPPGTVLNVADLSRRFRVPPYMLQEFLASLLRFGLVERRPRGGWRLLGFTRDFAVELSEFRLMLELNAIRHLLDLPDGHPIWRDLDRLEAAHQALAQDIAARFHDFSLLDQDFHMTLGSVVKNRFAAEFQKIIALIFHYHFQWDKSREQARNLAAIGEHLRLIGALKARDRPGALAAAEDHLKTSKATLLQSLRDHAGTWAGLTDGLKS